ncbi:MAG TPA: hypothetical protein DIC18_03620 [Clostridiales bacterium]|nr:hypothetical protein [Clostridiales bacterium]
MGQKRQILTKDLVLTALAAALLSAGKQALASIPNVEVVTLLIMLYAACFKPQIAFTATAVYIFIECFIWGLNTWVIAYLIHWNFVAFATFLLARVFKFKNRFIYLAFTILVTAAFGVLTTTIDAIVSASKSRYTFGAFFVAIYVRGIYFYIVHVVGNAVFNITLFAPLRDILNGLMVKYYGKDVFLKEEKPAGKDGKQKISKAGKPVTQLTEREECDKIISDLSQRESFEGSDKKK